MQTVLPTQSDLKQKLFHKQTEIVSDQQKYPQLFKWKTASLIMGSLAAILLIVLGVVLYNIESQPQNKIDLTFLKPIILSTQILKNSKQIINLAHNFQQIYGTTKFQQAQLLQRTSQLNEGMIRNSIYGKQNQKLLYLIELQHKRSQNTTQDIRFAVYMNSPFPMPEDDDYQPTQTYYSFQVKQQRKSSLVSLQTQQSLKLYSTNPVIKSIAQCKNYKFQPINQERPIGTFRLLNDLINFNFENQNVRFNVKGWQCFTPDLESQEGFRKKLYEIIGVGEIMQGEALMLKRLEVYHLK